jgi:hypothetical protein
MKKAAGCVSEISSEVTAADASDILEAPIAKFAK